ncbi:MAG TPA: 2-C-methyl-D-erythritol 4-phosphate cytidylyltransferase [Candidatus Polarisedimenticolia bacterium]|jgi:2-C-methyl-D-erythritol 4-phosphate cytidylyltransferase/2-C-methyl-D-erythritol 2,4-cyclodiphosphate synthase|nr:2-C-methyl-D-erythritol 4-phosphate cytidylyltransferase [Candidatus Polarisedimenticolia bacterium]
MSGEGSSSLSAAAILVAAGKGVRAGSGPPKQFRCLDGVPLLARAFQPFLLCREIHQIFLVVPEPEEARVRLSAWVPEGSPVDFVRGGETRQASTRKGLAATRADLVLVHDGVRPFVTPDLIRRVLAAAKRRGAAVPLVPVRETLKRIEPPDGAIQTVRRDDYALSQTPQGFRREVLEAALDRADREGFEGTDEAELVERLGHPLARVEGLGENLKITTPEDFRRAEAMLSRPGTSAPGGWRVGIGYDVHPLVPGRKLILGGVEIAHPAGPAGHSDGDLICHAATDALLGAAGLSDIGQTFPDTDAALKDASSLDLLAQAGRKVRQAGFALGNLDVIVVLEEPKIAPHASLMRERIAEALGCDAARIGVKGKRGEGLGFAGRREGVAAQAVALLFRQSEGPGR